MRLEIKIKGNAAEDYMIIEKEGDMTELLKTLQLAETAVKHYSGYALSSTEWSFQKYRTSSECVRGDGFQPFTNNPDNCRNCGAHRLNHEETK